MARDIEGEASRANVKAALESQGIIGEVNTLPSHANWIRTEGVEPVTYKGFMILSDGAATQQQPGATPMHRITDAQLGRDRDVGLLESTCMALTGSSWRVPFEYSVTG